MWAQKVQSGTQSFEIFLGVPLGSGEIWIQTI